MPKLNRRSLLKTISALGTTLPSLSMQGLFLALSKRLIEKTHAADGTSPRNFILFQMKGAPSRWTWTPLSPYENPTTSISSNLNVITRLTGNGNSCVGSYETTPIAIAARNGEVVNMPYIWQFDIASRNGGSRPMKDLLEEGMLVIQGIDVLNPDHTGAQANQFYPSGIKNSITSLAGDISDCPIPFIGMGTSPNPYTSLAGKAGINSLDYSGNWINNLLSPFLLDSSIQSKGFENEIEGIIKNIDNALMIIDSSYKTTISADNDARKMLKKELASLAANFLTRKSAYITLLQRTISDDESIGRIIGVTHESSSKRLEIPRIKSSSTDLDCRENILRVSEDHPRGYIPNLASIFATIEISILNEITPSIAASAQHFDMVNFDEHTEDHRTACFTNSLWNRGFAACLLELIDVLKADGKWDNTLIQFSGEFGRKGKKDGFGTDHAPDSSEVTFLGGHLEKGVNYVGQTLKEGDTSSNASYTGSWGKQANNSVFGYLTLGHLAATTADLLNVESPVTNAPSLVEEENGVFKAHHDLERTRIIDNS